MDKIFITGLKVDVLIGLHDFERQTKQPLLIDAQLAICADQSMQSDAIADTIDYDQVRLTIIEVAKHSTAILLEAFALQIMQKLFEKFAVDWIKLKITKPNFYPDVAGFGVIIERSRDAL